jgi:hypothetical protein
MDVSTLNSGTVDTKTWLNPVVGQLQAKTTSAEWFTTTDSATQTFFPNASIAYVYYNSIPATIVSDIPPQFFTLGRSKTLLPSSAFSLGALFEFFVAGSFQDQSPGSPSYVTISLAFKTSGAVTLSDLFCTAQITSGQSTDTNQMFHARSTFVVTAAGVSSMAISASTVSSVNGTANANVINNSEVFTINTPPRALNTTWPISPVIQSVAGPTNFTMYNWYLRRIA